MKLKQLIICSLITAQCWSQSTTNNNFFLGGKYLGFDGSNLANPLYIRTNAITRMRVNGLMPLHLINGAPKNVSGFVGISPSGHFNTPGNSPFTMLHLEGLNNSTGGGGGYRQWMGTGLFMKENSDAMYVGMKQESGINRSDAVVNWSDDTGIDNLRFIFTSTASGLGNSANPRETGSFNGYEYMRMTASGPPNSTGSNAGYIGIGPLFNNAQQPQNRLHMHAEDGMATYLQVSNEMGSALSGTGQTGADGLKLGVAQTAAAGGPKQFGYLQWQEATPFVVQTDWDAAPGGIPNGERMRITSVGALVNTESAAYLGITTPVNRTRISVSADGGAPVRRPLSLMYLGYDAPFTIFQNNGWRPWMDLGIFTGSGSDNMYVGLKNESAGTGNDRYDAVVSWGDNGVSNGPDNMRFIFTAATGLGTGNTPPATGTEGLEGMRMTPSTTAGMLTGVGGDPFTNLYGPTATSTNPTATLEVNSWGLATTPGGSSGLRFTDLNSTSPTIANPRSGYPWS